MLETSLATEIIAESKRQELERGIATRELRQAARNTGTRRGVRAALADGLIRVATCLDSRAGERRVALGR